MAVERCERSTYLCVDERHEHEGQRGPVRHGEVDEIPEGKAPYSIENERASLRL